MASDAALRCCDRSATRRRRTAFAKRFWKRSPNTRKRRPSPPDAAANPFTSTGHRGTELNKRNFLCVSSVAHGGEKCVRAEEPEGGERSPAAVSAGASTP